MRLGAVQHYAGCKGATGDNNQFYDAESEKEIEKEESLLVLELLPLVVPFCVCEQVKSALAAAKQQW